MYSETGRVCNETEWIFNSNEQVEELVEGVLSKYE